MVTNEWMMGYTTGVTSAASKLADLSGMDMTGAYMKGREPAPAKDWGKEQPTVPEKPNVVGSLISALLPMGIEYLKAKGEKAEEAKKLEQKKKDDAQKRIDDAAILAARNAHEIELEKIKANKPTTPPEDKPKTTSEIKDPPGVPA